MFVEEYHLRADSVCEEYIPLFHAIEYHKLDIVEYLLEHGADVNVVDSNGENALFIVFKAYHQDLERLPMCKLLVEHGIDVNCRSSIGNEQSVLQYGISMCARYGKTNVIRTLNYLIENGANE